MPARQLVVMSSQRTKEIQGVLLLQRRERVEQVDDLIGLRRTVLRIAGAPMFVDRLQEMGGPAVVEEEDRFSHRGAVRNSSGAALPLDDVVGEAGTHLVEGEVGEQVRVPVANAAIGELPVVSVGVWQCAHPLVASTGSGASRSATSLATGAAWHEAASSRSDWNSSLEMPISTLYASPEKIRLLRAACTSKSSCVIWHPAGASLRPVIT